MFVGSALGVKRYPRFACAASPACPTAIANRAAAALDGRDGGLPVRVMAMGRLDNIIARNRRPPRQERVIVSMLLGAIVLLVIVLAVFTDLGLPPDAREILRAHQP